MPDETCRECGEELKNTDYNTALNRVPYGSTTTNEIVVIGYKCHNCGYEEQF